VQEAADGGQDGGATCGAPYPADTPTAPTFRQRLNIPAVQPPPDRSAEVDPAQCTLHAPPGTSFRHGVTVGFTVMARNSAGAAVAARGLPFVYNVTGVGDSSSGTVFDLQNGTYFVYSTVYFSPALLQRQQVRQCSQASFAMELGLFCRAVGLVGPLHIPQSPQVCVRVRGHDTP
jgi:hypothetical protein